MFEKEKIISILASLNISSSDDCYDISSKVKAHKYNIKVCDGSSKICLVFPDVPYVVKWSTEGYSEAMREVQIYKDAVSKNLEKFFPDTIFLVSLNGIDFVAQEKIDFSVCECDLKNARIFSRITRTALDKTVAKMDREFQKASPFYRRRLDVQWAKMAIVLYGKKACKALCEFVIANKINDLHKSNIGYKNGRPIILDFSGFDRDT